MPETCQRCSGRYRYRAFFEGKRGQQLARRGRDSRMTDRPTKRHRSESYGEGTTVAKVPSNTSAKDSASTYVPIFTPCIWYTLVTSNVD